MRSFNLRPNPIYKTEYVSLQLKRGVILVKQTLLDFINHYMTNISFGDLPILPAKTIFEVKNKVKINLDHNFSRYLGMEKNQIPEDFLLRPTEIFLKDRWNMFKLGNF